MEKQIEVTKMVDFEKEERYILKGVICCQREEMLHCLVKNRKKERRHILAQNLFIVSGQITFVFSYYSLHIYGLC